MRKLFGENAVSTDVKVKEIEQPVNVDATSHTRLGWFIVVLGIGGFFLWALFAPLDKGVPISGTVTVASNRKAIQHLTGGTVEEILVKDGDTVKAGQVLVRMNDVQVRSQAEISRSQYLSARAIEARLLAELDGKHQITFGPELEKLANDPQVANLMSVQTQLFTSRQSAIHNELAAFDENIAGIKAQLRGQDQTLESLKQQQQFLQEQLDGIRDLAKEGYVARNRVLELERSYAQVAGSIAELVGNIGRSQRQIGELNLRRLQRKQEYQKEVRSQLSDTQREANSLANRLASQDFDLSNVLVKSPVDGTVVGMNVFTNGGVIAPGFRMMDVVPSSDPLVVEGQIPVNLIDKVHPGLKVELIFTAFNQNRTPHVPGVLTQVSADRFTDEKNGMPYYKAKAIVAPEGMKLIADLQIRPGMPVEAFIKTGERTMMSYLLKPLLDRAKTSLTEE